MSLADQLRHESIQEGQHQSCNMRTIDIGIGHDNNLVITQLADIKIFIDTCTKCSDHRFNFCVAENTIQTCFFYIQNLSTKRKYCLRCTVSGSLGTSTGGITLYDVDLAVLRILVTAIGKFTGKCCAV